MPATESDAKHSENKSILVAEDDYSNFLLLKVYLKHLDYQILHAQNGLEAIQIATNNNPTLIIMDIKMPLKDGLEATKKIKAQKPQIPIIALTAYALSGDKEKALKAGINEYITKPVSKDDLINLINKYIPASERT